MERPLVIITFQGVLGDFFKIMEYQLSKMLLCPSSICSNKRSLPVSRTNHTCGSELAPLRASDISPDTSKSSYSIATQISKTMEQSTPKSIR